MSELKATSSGEIRARDALLGYWWYEKFEADKATTWHKYKRCLAMAQVLEHVCPITKRKAKWRKKWHKHWLAIAQKFKEVW